MRNIKIIIQYDGTNYCGWQRQVDSLGIQGNIENAIYEITKEKIKLTGSGRTDAGVHALGQVANFKLNSMIPINKIPSALNSKLNKDISIIEAREVDEHFHSRYCAKRKRYRYVIYNYHQRNPIISKFSYYIKYDLNFEHMKREAKSLIGTHDFKGFMSSGSNVKDTIRTIYDVDFKKYGNVITMEIEGNGFLYNMVRIIVGTLVDIGRGKVQNSMIDIINSKNRSMTGHTAPAHGLFLKKVDY